MKTEDVYFAMSAISINIKHEGTIYDWMFGKGIVPVVKWIGKPTLVISKENIFNKFALKDLNKFLRYYTIKLPTKVGKVFVSGKTLIPFNEITGNTNKNLSKRKIKQIGKKYYENYLKELKEE